MIPYDILQIEAVGLLEASLCSVHRTFLNLHLEARLTFFFSCTTRNVVTHYTSRFQIILSWSTTQAVYIKIVLYSLFVHCIFQYVLHQENCYTYMQIYLLKNKIY